MIGPNFRSTEADERAMTPPSPDPNRFPPAERALESFAAGLRRESELAGQGGFDEAGFDELCRAVDGELDESESALWTERLAHDPGLGRRAADLDRFRAELAKNGRVLSFRRPPARVSLSGWLAAAAVLLLAVSVREVPKIVDEHGSLRAAAASMFEEEVFADGFEAGEASGWSSVSPSG